MRTVPPVCRRAYPPIRALFVKEQNFAASAGLPAPWLPVPYRPVPGIAICHVSVDHHAVMIAEHDLAGPLPYWPLGIRWLHLMRDAPVLVSW